MPLLKTKTRAVSLEDFILLGSVKGEVQIFDNVVIMKTLPSGFIEKLSIQSSGLDMLAKDKMFKIETLARALKKINGQPLIVESVEDEETDIPRAETLEKIKKVLRGWEQPLIDIFYEEYEKLVVEQKKFFEEVKKKFEKKISPS